MVLSAADAQIPAPVAGGVGGGGGGGGAPAICKAEGMDAIEGKLSSLQIGGADESNPKKPAFFGFPPSPGNGITLDADDDSGGDRVVNSTSTSTSHGNGSAPGAGSSGGGGGVTYKNSNGGGTPVAAGRGPSSGSTSTSSVSRRYGVPMASNSRSATGGPNRGGGGGVAFHDDRRKSGGSGGVGRRTGGGSGGIAGGAGLGRGGGRMAHVAGSFRGGYETAAAAAAAASPAQGPVDYPVLQVVPPHVSFGGNPGAMSPGSANMYGTGSGGGGGSSGVMQQAAAAPFSLGSHHDPSQQAAIMGQQLQSGGLFYANTYAGQAPGTPTMSHMTTPQGAATSGGFPSSPGHSGGYGMQQMGGMDMTRGMANGYTAIGGGGMVHGMGVMPGTPTMQSPYGAYWASGDVSSGSGYGGMSNGASSYGRGYAASESNVIDSGPASLSIKTHSNNSHLHYLASPGGSSVAGGGGGGGPLQRSASFDLYGFGGGQHQHHQPHHHQPHHHQPHHAYDGRDYGGQGAYSPSPAGSADGYGPASYYGYGVHAASPKMGGGFDRERPRDRARSGSVLSMGSMASLVSSAGGGAFGGDHHREHELSMATENLTLGEIDGNVFRMSKDQIGCRLLQLKLDQGEPAFVSKICAEAQPFLCEMMTDPFGNYLFQKIVEKLDEPSRTDLITQVAGQMVDAGLNLHGTRSVQKLIEVCRGTPMQVALVVDALRGATVALSMDTNGNHVVQRLLQHLAPEDNAFVFEVLAEALVPVATHRHGCCVLQRAIDAATVDQSRLLVSEVSKHALQLMQDPYGNYVVQYILGICSREEANTLVNVPIGKVAMLSMQKFSSNVIEKCMDRASEDMIVKYVQELADPAAMRPLLQDQYANYVIQKMLQLAPRDAALILVKSIKDHLGFMRNSSGGRRMLNKIAKRFPEVSLEDEMPPVTGIRTASVIEV